jgi:hypothetical protein
MSDKIKEIKVKDVTAIGQLEVLVKSLAFKKVLEDLIDLQTAHIKDEYVAWQFIEDFTKEIYPEYDNTKHSITVNSKENILTIISKES